MNNFYLTLKTTLLSVFALFSFLASANDDYTVLKEKYPEAKAAFQRSTTTIRYEYNSDKNTLEIVEQEDHEVVALKANFNFVQKVYFNDQSAIEKVTIRNGKGKKVYFDKYCGHYEVDNIFYSDAQICAYRIASDGMGDQIKFHSVRRIFDSKYFSKIFFHKQHPSVEGEVTIKIPNWVDAEILEFNFEGYEIEKSIVNETSTDSKTIKYTVKNLPTIESEANQPGSSMVLPHLLLLTKSYLHNNLKHKILEDSTDLYDWYRTLTTSLENDYAAIEPTVKKITEGLQTDQDKIEAIYNWVQDNIKYIAFEDGIAGFKPEEAQTVLFNRYGDCKGMANLTKVMLEIAGYDARLTWIGTNILPYTYEIPSLAVDNHMICTLFSEDELLILDATDKYQQFNAVPAQLQGKEMMIENGDDFMIVKVPEENKSTNEINYHFAGSIENDRIVGNGNTNLSGELKKLYLSIIDFAHHDKKEELFKYIATGQDDLDDVSLISDLKAGRNEAFLIDYKLVTKHQVERFGNDMYIDVDLVKNLYDLEIDDERAISYDFGYNFSYNMSSELNLPPGFSISYVPENLTINNELLEFESAYKVSEKRLKYTRKLKVKKRTIETSEFDSWNRSINEIKTFYNDQVILKYNEN